MAVQQQQPMISFRRGTRQHFDYQGRMEYQAGRTARFPLDQVGLLNRFFVHVNGTMTVDGGLEQLLPDGPFSLIRRLRFSLNTGVTIDDISGYGLFLINHLIERGFNPQSSARPDVYAAGTNDGVNPWSFILEVPVASNDGINFEVGLVNLQTEELRATVEIDWAPESEVITMGGTPPPSFVGGADIHVEWYEIPDPTVVEFPALNIVHRILMDTSPITATGDTYYNILRQGTLQQLLHVIRLNNIRDTNNWSELRIELNRSDKVYRYRRALLLHSMARNFGQDFPDGVALWDWWHSQLDVSQGDGRDFVDTQAIAQVSSVVAITGGLGGAGTNNLDTIRRFTQVATP